MTKIGGKWNLAVSVDGTPVRRGGVDLEAVYGPLTAGDCVVRLSATVVKMHCFEDPRTVLYYPRTYAIRDVEASMQNSKDLGSSLVRMQTGDAKVF